MAGRREKKIKFLAWPHEPEKYPTASRELSYLHPIKNGFFISLYRHQYCRSKLCESRSLDEVSDWSAAKNVS